MPPPSRSPRTAELCSRGWNHSSESRLMLQSEKNDEDVDDLFLFTEMKKHESESSAEIAHFSDRRRDSPQASDGSKNEYNWLLTPPGTPLNGTDRETKPVENPRNKARTQTQTTTIPRRPTNGKTQTRGTAAKRELSSRPSNGNIKAKEKQNGFDLISVIEEVVQVPAYGPSEQTIDSTQETLVDNSKLQKSCFEKDVLDQNGHVCATKSETAAELSKTTEAQRNLASEGATGNQMALTQISRPSLQQLVKSASDLKNFQYVYYKRNKNLQRFNRKTQALSNKELVKPPKIESKCNCSIM